MSLKDVKGVEQVNNELDKLANNLDNLRKSNENSQIIDSSSAVRELNNIADSVKNVVGAVDDSKSRIAVSMADMGSSMGSLLTIINDIKNANLGSDVETQLQKASAPIEKFVQLFSQLSSMKMEIDDKNISQANDVINGLTSSLREMKQVVSENSSTAALSSITDGLNNIEQHLQGGKLVNYYNDLAGAVKSTNEEMKKTGDIAQVNTMSVNNLVGTMEGLMSATKGMNAGLNDMFAKITGPGTDSGVFNDIKKQIDSISNAMSVMQTNVKSKDVWDDPKILPAETEKIQQSLEKMLESQSQAFSQALGKMASGEFDSRIKEYSELKQLLAKNTEQMMGVLNDPGETPIQTAGMSDEQFKKITDARDKAFKDLEKLQKLFDNIDLSNLQAGRNANFDVETQGYGQRLSNAYNNTDDHHAQLNRMAAGRSLGSEYEFGMGKIGRDASNIYRNAGVLQREVNDPNSAMDWQERKAAKNIDFDGISEQAQKLAALQQEFERAKDQFTGAYSKAVKSGDPQDMEDAKKRYAPLAAMQQNVQKSAMNLGGAIKIASPEDKERLGKEATALWKDIQSLIKDTSSSSDSLYMMGKTLKVDDEILSGLKNGTNGVKDIKSAMEDAEKQSTSLWSSMKSGLSDIMSPLAMVGKGLGALGIGGLAGGLGGMLGKTVGMYNEQGRHVWESMRAGASYGMDGLDQGNFGRAQQRLDKGHDWHAATGGRVGAYDLNNAYNNAMSQVGGGYGKSASQGSQDIDELVNKTFATQKVMGIDQGTMNEAYKTFYKDMGQSASEAADAIGRVTSTAAAANIPAAQYLKMVTGIAQQYMKIGLSGKDAENVLGNLINQGIRADVARDMAGQTGSAMGKFADDNNQVAYAGAMMGMDPWEAIGKSYNSHDSKGNVRSEWSHEMGKMADTMVNTYAGAAGGDPNVKRKVLGDYFKGMGYDRRTSSMLTNSHMEGNTKLFESILQEAESKKDNPNSKMEAELEKMTGVLSGQDKIMAEMQKHLYDLAKTIGPEITQILMEMKGSILKFIDSMGSILKTITEAIRNFSQSSLFQNIVKPGMEKVVESPGNMAMGLGGLWLGKKLLTGGLGKLSSLGTTGAARGTRAAAGAIARNPKTAVAAIVGMLAVGAASKAFASPRWEGGDSDGVMGHMASRLDDIHEVLSEGGINVKGGAGAYKPGEKDSQLANHAMTGGLGTLGNSDVGDPLMAGLLSAGTWYGGSKAAGLVDKFGKQSMHAADFKTYGKLALQGEESAAGLATLSAGSLARNALGRFGLTAVATEGVGAAYDLYEHSQKGDLVAGDKGRVAATAGVNLGYMGMGAAIGSIVPGVGTVVGAGIGGLVGAGVDMFGSKDENGMNVNDRMKSSLTYMMTGKHTDELEKERQTKMDEAKYGSVYGSKDSKEMVKAKLEMMGYSDKEAEQMSANLKSNEETLKANGVNMTNMTVAQKAYMAEHMEKVGLNSKTINDGTDASKKLLGGVKDLASAINNTDFGSKVNKHQDKREDNVRGKIEGELNDKAVLSTMFNHKSFDLKQWREKLVDDLKANPEDLGKVREISDVDSKLEKLQRGKYLLDNGEEQRRLDHGASYDNLSDWDKMGSGSREQFINKQLQIDKNDADEMRGLYGQEYVDKRIADGALDNGAAAVENAVTNPGGDATTATAKTEADNLAAAKADDSRTKVSKEATEKVVKQGQKSEEQQKESNKLINHLTDTEKLLFKELEASAHSDTKILVLKLDELKKVLEAIRLTSGNGVSGAGGKVKGNAYNELKKADPEISKWVDEASSKYGVNKNLIATIMKQESSFRRGLGKNSAGAEGLMQVIGDKGTGLNPSNDHDNVMIGTKYLGEMLKEFNGDERLAFAGYNMGPNGVKELQKKYGNSWESIAKYTPTETQNYIRDNFGAGGANGSPFNVDFDKNRGSNGCTAVAAEALQGNEYADKLSSQSLYVPTWTQTAMADGKFRSHESGYKAQQGDIVVVKTLGDEESQKYGSHVVVANGDGNFTGNSSSKEHAVVDSLDKFEGKILGYIQTGGAGNNDPNSDAAIKAATAATNAAIAAQTNSAANNAAVTAAAANAVANGQAPPAAATTDATTAATADPSASVIGTTANVLAQAGYTGKAFHDGSMINHHTGQIDAYYSNDSNRQLNWGNIKNTISGLGGQVHGMSSRQVMAQSKQMRDAYDGGMSYEKQKAAMATGIIGQMPIVAPPKELLANIEANTKSGQLDNTQISTAQEQQKAAGNIETAGQEISINIVTSGELADKLLPVIKDELGKLGMKVDKIEKSAVNAGKTAVNAIRNTEQLNGQRSDAYK